MEPNFQDWLEDHIFTPSELETWLVCPYRFYAESFLGLKEPPSLEPEMTPREIGTVMHRILERFLEGKDWSREKIHRISSEILDNFDRPGLSSPLFSLQKKRIERTLDSFLEMEAAILKKEEGPLPERYEWRFGDGKTPPLEIEVMGEKPILIKGRVDRIDVDRKRKRFLVIDYKTGSRRKTPLAIPLYLLAVRTILLPGFQPAGGVLFYLSDMTKEEWPVAGPEGDGLFAETEEKVRGIVGEMRKGIFPSREESCEPFCPFRDICRMRTMFF